MSAPRIEKLTVRNLRSIGDDRVTVRFPTDGVLVLLGENNAGKSNITRGLEILFGDQWPGTRRLEDHDFHGRDSDGIAIEIGAVVSGITCPYCHNGDVAHFKWTYDPDSPSQDGNPVIYRFTCSDCIKTFPNNAMRASLAAAVLDADRRLDYQLSYASKYTMLSKLMHRFHERLLRDPQRKAQLAGVFDGLLQQFGAVPEFAKFKERGASSEHRVARLRTFRSTACPRRTESAPPDEHGPSRARSGLVRASTRCSLRPTSRQGYGLSTSRSSVTGSSVFGDAADGTPSQPAHGCPR